ncbi:putative rta1 [Venustampulla echinocandica]|uniref:Putative rta1 n=1 Tax=Venustampulla echinocandica TaxID=2656787 RepID=A0A370TZE0_9HELO|nr:putative rta1 [Venustampulla echinocandica]RDL40884.1 putative rta1 [Venustampulla echinocandica]
MTATNNLPPDGSWSFYSYKPVKALPIIFAIFFLVCGITMIYQCLAKYGWKLYTYIMTFTCTIWVAGFCCRMASIYNDENLGLFAAQYVLLFLGPPCFAGAEYLVLGRVLAYLPYHTPIHPGRVISTFVFLGVVVEALSANGAAALTVAKTADKRNSALTRMLAALILQAVLEIFFSSLVALVEIRCRKAKTFPRNVRIVCYLLYITSFMMLVRCIFRVVEGIEVRDCLGVPNCGTISQKEWLFYVFEVANISLFVLLLTIFPPGKYLPPNDKVYLDPLDGSERAGPGFAQADRRPFWQTVMDPFNFQLLTTGSGVAVEKFWEGDNPVYTRDGVVPKQNSRG